MISYIKGVLNKKNPGFVIIETGGIGYHVNISLSTFSKLPPEGEDVVIYIRQFVREDSIELFGFFDEAEKELFNLLNKVSKVGPKLALAILSGFQTDKIKELIVNKDIAKLATIPGIGRKTAERIVLELKDKFEELTGIDSCCNNMFAEDIVSALINLGYKKNECLKVVGSIDTTNMSFEDALKVALKKMTER